MLISFASFLKAFHTLKKKIKKIVLLNIIKFLGGEIQLSSIRIQRSAFLFNFIKFEPPGHGKF